MTDDGNRRSLLARVAAILGAFTEDDLRYDIAGLAETVGLPRSTVSRLAGDLTDLGLLERGADGRVSIGPRLWAIGETSPLAVVLRERALPHLTALFQMTHEAAHIAVLDRAEALYVARVTGVDSVRTLVRVGGRLPLHTTGVGKALLASCEDADIDEYLSRPLVRETSFSVTDTRVLREHIRQLRDDGYTVTHEEMTLGTSSIAAPVPRVDGWPPIAVGIVMRADRPENPYLAPAVVRAAREVGRELAALAP
jgi:DNA-binding IclR family transcriptional regulator